MSKCVLPAKNIISFVLLSTQSQINNTLKHESVAATLIYMYIIITLWEVSGIS